MKNIRPLTIITSCASLTLLLALPSLAQETAVEKTTKSTTVDPAGNTETTTTTTAGTISEFGDQRIVVRTESAPDPISYSYSKTTTYVDEAGAPVSMELVKSGLPVTVYYTTEGDARVATKVIVRKRTLPVPAGKPDASATTTLGTISEFGSDVLRRPHQDFVCSRALQIHQDDHLRG